MTTFLDTDTISLSIRKHLNALPPNCLADFVGILWSVLVALDLDSKVVDEMAKLGDSDMQNTLDRVIKAMATAVNAVPEEGEFFVSLAVDPVTTIVNLVGLASTRKAAEEHRNRVLNKTANFAVVKSTYNMGHDIKEWLIRCGFKAPLARATTLLVLETIKQTVKLVVKEREAQQQETTGTN